MQYLWIFLGGGLGSVLRVLSSSWLNRLTAPHWPWGTLAVNALGSLAIGWLIARFPADPRVAMRMQPFLVLGLCGGFTTFSSFSAETLLLLRSGHWPTASANVVLSLASCFLAVALGYWLGAPNRT